MSWASSFRILARSRSGPQALAGLSFSSSLTTRCLVSLILPMDGKGVPSGIGISSLSSFVRAWIHTGGLRCQPYLLGRHAVVPFP